MTTEQSPWPGWLVIRRQWRLALAAYFMLAVVTLPTGVAVGVLMHEFFGAREVGALVAARPHFPSFVEVVIERPTSWSVVLAVVIVAALTWWIVQTYIVGAVLASGRLGKPVTMRGALALGGRQLWGLVGLALMGLPFVLVFGGLAFLAVSKLTEALTEGTTSTATIMAVRMSLTFVALVILVWASGTHDLMRVKKVDGAGVFSAFAGGLWSGLWRPFSVIGRALPWALAAWLLTLVISFVDAQFVWSTPAAVAMGIGLQQLLVLLRVLTRFGGLGAIQSLVAPPETIA